MGKTPGTDEFKTARFGNIFFGASEEWNNKTHIKAIFGSSYVSSDAMKSGQELEPLILATFAEVMNQDVFTLTGPIVSLDHPNLTINPDAATETHTIEIKLIISEIRGNTLLRRLAPFREHEMQVAKQQMAFKRPAFLVYYVIKEETMLVFEYPPLDASREEEYINLAKTIQINLSSFLHLFLTNKFTY